MKKRIKQFFIALSALLLVVLLMASILFFKYRQFVGAPQNALTTSYAPSQYGKYVNPFIGSGGYYYVCANNFPGATTPFGLVRLSPDTRSTIGNYEAMNTSGYYYSDNKIIGFSHTRLSGTGATDGGHFRVAPVAGKVSDKMRIEGMNAKYTHTDEKAFPGYYAVRLKDSGILAEFTATTRTGLHRYTFPENMEKHILIDVSSTLGNKKIEDGFVKIIPEQKEIEGYIRTHGTFASRYDGIKVYFAGRFNQPFKSYGVSKGEEFLLNKKSVSGDKVGIDISFEEHASSVIELRLAISHVSIANARLNLDKETGGKTFDDVLKEATVAWEEKLSLIQIEALSDKQKTIFYTALYRSFSMPTIFNDVNGEYMGFDKKVHIADTFTYYTDLSLWDTYRTTHPLYTLIAPEEHRDMIISLVKMSEQGGCLPRWPSGNGYTGSMIGSPADIVIAEAYLKGIKDFDIEHAYQAMKKVALNNMPSNAKFISRRGIESYLKNGYCAADDMDKAVSKTLEYAWADDAIGRLAGELGYTDDAKLFNEHSKYYKNLWNPATQYFHPKNRDGNFVEKFDPLQLTYTDWDEEYTDDYVEGSALQWRYAVPYDPQGLISLFNSVTDFNNELNDFFAKSDPAMAAWHPGSYYWHGNEPDIHAAYLFNESGRPDLTQKWSRWILDNKYDTTYDGLDGNDDGATLSAWYIFSVLGFYPQAGSDIYQIGSPLFKAAEIDIGNEMLKIETENYSPDNVYIKNVWLNGAPLKQRWFKHSDIASGGVLRFEMSKTPVLLSAD